jgi:hypothetical protein
MMMMMRVLQHVFWEADSAAVAALFLAAGCVIGKLNTACILFACNI